MRSRKFYAAAVCALVAALTYAMGGLWQSGFCTAFTVVLVIDGVIGEG